MLSRLDKIMTGAGVASRSEAAKLVKLGAVTVNGVTASSPADKYETDGLELYVSGERIALTSRVCIMMNKPSGVLSATEDRDQRTVLDLLDGRYRRMELFPIGRLDKDTEGLLLITDDGQLAHNVISPKKNIWKVYYAETDGELSQSDADAFESGLTLGDGTECLPAHLEFTGGGVLVTVREGKYHQVKRMLASRGAHVTYLKRLSVGGLRLDEALAPGEYRQLSESEIDLIFSTK